MGTPAYMSPEQAGGLEADERSDVYSLCVLLHELLGLKHYLGEMHSLDEVVRGVLTIEPPMLATVKHPTQPPTPADLGHVVRKGLRKDPNDRYQTVGELLDRLRARKDGYIPIQCPITFTKRIINGLTHAVDRHPMGTLLSLATVSLGGVGGLVYGALHLFGVA
jgi:serine/threonine-protein kinase